MCVWRRHLYVCGHGSLHDLHLIQECAELLRQLGRITGPEGEDPLALPFDPFSCGPTQRDVYTVVFPHVCPRCAARSRGSTDGAGDGAAMRVPWLERVAGRIFRGDSYEALAIEYNWHVANGGLLGTGGGLMGVVGAAQS